MSKQKTRNEHQRKWEKEQARLKMAKNLKKSQGKPLAQAKRPA